MNRFTRTARLLAACAALSACEVNVDTPDAPSGEAAAADVVEHELLPGALNEFCDFGPDVTTVRSDVSVDLSREMSSSRNGAPDGSARAEARVIVSACLVRDATVDPPRYFVLAQQNVTAEAALFVEEPSKANYGFYNVGLGVFVRPADPSVATLRSDISAPRTENESIEVSEKRTLTVGGGVKAGCEAGMTGGNPSATCKQEASVNVSWSRERYRGTVEQAWEVMRSPDANLAEQEAGWHWYQNEFYDGSLPEDAREDACADKAFQRGEFLLEQLPKMGRQLDVNALAIWEVERPADDRLVFEVEAFHDLDLAYKKTAKKLCHGKRNQDSGRLTLHFAPFDGEAIPADPEPESDAPCVPIPFTQECVESPAR